MSETTSDDEDTRAAEIPIDVDQALRDAEYQLALLRALDERASRLERNVAISVLIAAAFVTALTAWMFRTTSQDAELAIAGQTVNVIGTFLTLTGVVVGLLAFILAQRERVRTQRDYIQAETTRLRLALEEARRRLKALQERSVQ